MSNMQSMIFLQNLIKKYSGQTLKGQMLDRKSRLGKAANSEKRFAGLLPQEQLRAMSHNTSDVLNNAENFTPMKEADYIRSQYNKRSSLLEEADLKKIGKDSQ